MIYLKIHIELQSRTHIWLVFYMDSPRCHKMCYSVDYSMQWVNSVCTTAQIQWINSLQSSPFSSDRRQLQMLNNSDQTWVRQRLPALKYSTILICQPKPWWTIRKEIWAPNTCQNALAKSSSEMYGSDIQQDRMSGFSKDSTWSSIPKSQLLLSESQVVERALVWAWSWDFTIQTMARSWSMTSISENLMCRSSEETWVSSCRSQHSLTIQLKRIFYMETPKLLILR